jgi:hypothetical protein
VIERVRVLTPSLWLSQEEAIAFDPVSMWRAVGWPARLVVILILIMCVLSAGVMVDRWRSR